MEKSYSQYIFKYINGDLSDEDRKMLENDDEFMKKVITLSRNKKYYDKASDNVKSNGNFVLKLIDTFSYDHGFLAKVGKTFFKLNKRDSKGEVEVAIELTKIYNETQDEVLHEFYEQSEDYYKNILDKIRRELMAMEDPDEREALGEGFGFANASFCDSDIAREFVASRLTQDLLLDNPMYDFEELVHYYISSLKQIPDGLERRFIFDYLKGCDQELANFLGLHPSIVDKYIPMVIEVKQNWDNYLNELNAYKLQQVHDEMERYIVENNLSYDMMELYRGMIDLSVRKEKIYNYLPLEELGNADYRAVNISKMDIPEYKFVRHMVQYMDDLFERDAPYDMILADDYYEEPKGNVASIKPFLKGKK